MNYKTIEKLQKEYGYFEMQKLINSGQCWKMDGSTGREAMRCLTDGFCMLPKKAYTDYYGNKVPSRDELVAGTLGTYKKCHDFWSGVVDGSIFLEL